MRHVFAIVKYVPAVLCGLLMVAWVVSLWVAFGIVSDSKAGIAFDRGCLSLWDYRDQGPWYQHPVRFWSFSKVDMRVGIFGRLSAFKVTAFGYWIYVPIPLILTLLLPVSLAPLTRFRFPLWAYFAWTGLIAAELAYYLS